MQSNQICDYCIHQRTPDIMCSCIECNDEDMSECFEGKDMVVVSSHSAIMYDVGGVSNKSVAGLNDERANIATLQKLVGERNSRYNG